MYLHGEVRKASGTAVGDEVDIEVQFDADYRSGPAHPMPLWLGDALDRHAKAKAAFFALVPSQQKEILRYLAGLKSVEAQTRNTKQLLQVLSGTQGRYMGRDWNT